ncbi:M20 family metallopeptidase [Cupriavidus consociatus]|uniref:M20 family metallopeptidase n=1 Tax=Cupriavidus consociatus TaxID=2821357 RepID=UPI001AE39255|nr:MULTISPECIES: M20 family metallopeptidase [unclassified Cupriavidus]MBP0623107.1 M20 family metallopeptidase [Cupriavidus sp. LEh25]MDK2659798.1 M20 family metallopeptidase [Cupriavidus sp. LEh21]
MMPSTPLIDIASAESLATSLTQQFVKVDTVNPPGNESALARLIGALLVEAGLQTTFHTLADGRESLVAWTGSPNEGPKLCFTGHLDTVPFGSAPWSLSPLSGEIQGDRLYGRGSSDMKAGIAAFIAALLWHRATNGQHAAVILVLTAGEETGCEGAKALRTLTQPAFNVGAMVVGEPTANEVVIGHKGALWIRAQAHGVTAHGAMPERGDNAIYHVVDAIHRLRLFNFHAPEDELLGHPTLNVGTIAGGLNVNSVPDHALFEVDVRTVCGMAHDKLLDELGAYLGDRVALRAKLDVPALRQEMSSPWIAHVSRMVSQITGSQNGGRAVSFFTDGPVLREIFGAVPTVILGPGEPSMAHKTDEYCNVSSIITAVNIYARIIEAWESKREQ